MLNIYIENYRRDKLGTNWRFRWGNYITETTYHRHPILPAYLYRKNFFFKIYHKQNYSIGDGFYMKHVEEKKLEFVNYYNPTKCFQKKTYNN